MITHSPTSSLGLHEPFLKRAADGSEQTDGDLGLGAFLTLRLADQFGAEINGSGRAAIEYQCSATRKFIEDIRPRSERTAMLLDLVRVAEVALELSEPRLLFPPLLAFAYCLEKEPRVDQALDVFETMLRLSDGRDADEEVAALLQLGRVLRNAGRLGEARSAYEQSGAMAARLHDKHSVLLSQIGVGVVARFLGNLPDSERTLRSVIAEARKCDNRDAEARACHDLAGTLHFAGRATEAVPLVFRAHELYESPLQQAKALSDTGAILKELGHYTAAKDALSLVLVHDLPPDERARVELEHLDLAALTGDRFTFERCRQTLAVKSGALLPEVQLDFELKLGVGLSQFEEYEHGEAHLRRAIALAEQFGMAERIFYAEQQLEEAQQRRTQPPKVSSVAVSNADGSRPLQETVARLECLAANEKA
jgi:tetratricopeptide (TPR) repeat protein